ncbi:MAG: M28 family peptidase, partial [Solirubrobacterales bacterium]|nr:M28 family peptidase [Solirubrobacterales bacterium]
MLDLRVYRAAFVPLLIAVLVAAFSLESQPRAISTSLAPDAFDGEAAFANLGRLTEAFGSRRPGSAEDAALADRVARDLAALGPGTVTRSRTTAQTIDGEQELETVIATRPGKPGPGLVVVAHRDAAGPVSEAALSGTAALLELARVASTGSLSRSITFVSTSGGSGGLAGARAAIDDLDTPVDAVLVLGDVASRSLRKPWVVGWSNGEGVAPLRLQRTVAAAVRGETGQNPGAPRAGAQWARLAFPMTVGEQGAFLEAGLPAVLLSASGERPPEAGAAVSEQRLGVFGRSALRAISALDAGPDIASGPESRLVTLRKVLPGWAVLLLVGAALLPVWIATLDGFARVRRRKQPVGLGLRWVLAFALPFLAVWVAAVLLGLSGLIPARPGAPVPESALPGGSTAVGVVGALVLAFALAWYALRPLLLRGKDAEALPGNGHAAAAMIVVSFVSFVLWVRNPWAAALLVLPAHLWLLGVAPEVRLPRALAVGLGLVALLPFALAVLSLAGQLGYGPADATWSLV